MKHLAYTLAWSVKDASPKNLMLGFLVGATAIVGIMALAAKLLYHTRF